MYWIEFIDTKKVHRPLYFRLLITWQRVQGWLLMRWPFYTIGFEPLKWLTMPLQSVGKLNVRVYKQEVNLLLKMRNV